jgi:hypothetical protein
MLRVAQGLTHFAASAVPKDRGGPSNPAARTDGSIPKDQRRPLPPPGCLRVRLRIPPSLRRNIGACRSPVRPANTASSRRSRVLMRSIARSQPSPSICWRNPERPVAVRRESPFFFFLESIIYRLRSTLNGNRPSWSFDPGPAQPLQRRLSYGSMPWIGPTPDDLSVSGFSP